MRRYRTDEEEDVEVETRDEPRERYTGHERAAGKTSRALGRPVPGETRGEIDRMPRPAHEREREGVLPARGRAHPRETAPPG